MVKPNFFILGAPKCGTTALAAWLSDHPDVFVSAEKEPHYFNTDMSHRGITDPAQYQALFARASDQTAVGEASVWYLYSRAAVANIESYADRPRYIVCLRNPVDMAYSLHEQQVFSGNEDVIDFGAAWDLADRRRAGEALSAVASDATTLVYPDACALGSQLERLFQTVEPARVHIVVMDDLRADSGAVFEGVQRFLGVTPDPTIPRPVVNAAKTRRSTALQKFTRTLGGLKTATGMKGSLGILRRMDAVNRKPHKRPKMDQALHARLTSHFEPEIARLERLLGRDLSGWRR